jgi:hypothetical protein
MIAWMKDIIDTLNTSQLCSLLAGDATNNTLISCLARTRSKWPIIYECGVDTIYEIRTAFKKIGEQLDLDICDFLDSVAPEQLVDNLCDATFDSDARCEQLKLSGLSEEECQEQIDRELEDLKNKVSKFANLKLFDINPLSNHVPPICGPYGSFEIPPGVEDTMERITDNLLTNVKSSLMIDLETLKFFSVPPRAILAASDPSEMAEAHKMFTNVIKGDKVTACAHRACEEIFDAILPAIEQAIYKGFHVGSNPKLFTNEDEREILKSVPLPQPGDDADTNRWVALAAGYGAPAPEAIAAIQTAVNATKSGMSATGYVDVIPSNFSYDECKKSPAEPGSKCEDPGADKAHFGPKILGNYPLDIIPKTLGVFLGKESDEPTGDPEEDLKNLRDSMIAAGTFPAAALDPDAFAEQFIKADAKVNKELYDYLEPG